MAVLKSELHLWTLKSQLLITDTGLGCLPYHDKTDKGANLQSGASTHLYLEEKQAYVESHGKTWTPKNKRPDRLRDHIKELEDAMSGASIFFSWWKSEDTILVLLSSGVLFWVTISHDVGDITKITKDSSLVGRMTLSNICDVVFTGSFIALCSSDKSKLELIQFSKGSLTDVNHKKLSTLEPKISTVDLPGRPGRSQHRKIQATSSGDALLIYWPATSEGAWTWAPMSNEEERANLCVVSLANGKPTVVAFTKTDSDPLDVQFSCKDSTKILSIERSVSTKNPRADICTYELTKSRIHQTHHQALPLTSQLTRAKWDNSQSSLVLACEDNSIVLYIDSVKTTVTSRTDIQCDNLVWSPNNSLILAINQKSDLQVFDKSLTSLNLTMEGAEHIPQLKLSNFFRLSPHVKQVLWCSHSTHSAGQSRSTRNTLLLSFDRGPLAMLKFIGGDFGNSDISCLLLIAEYLKQQAFTQAVGLLKMMNWDTEGLDCFQSLVRIVNSLLKQPLCKQYEDLLEASLGCFYAPQRALSEVVILEYRTHVGNLARRFFHHLIRYSRFEKAFLLAVDVNSRDLFMDIHYAALDAGQTRLASAARHKATLCDEELVFSDSCSSVNGDLMSEDDLSPISSDDSIVDSLEHAQAVVQARINGHAPPLPPRKQVNPPLPPPRKFAGIAPSLHKTPSSGDSTPPLPPRARQKGSMANSRHHSKASSPLTPEQTPVSEQNSGSAKYHRVTGCTLPGGYTYDMDPAVTQRLIEDFNSMMVDESVDFNQLTGLRNTENEAIDRKPVKVIHFGLV